MEEIASKLTPNCIIFTEKHQSFLWGEKQPFHRPMSIHRGLS